MKTSDTSARAVREGRLVYYQQNATEPEFWADRWESYDAYSRLENYRRGELNHYAIIFPKWLPTGEPILEAGCGTCQYMIALDSRGYRVIGVDYSAETLKKAKSMAPELNVVAGDISALPWPEGHFGACMLLGVVEHYPEGPDVLLHESRRVLKDDGLLICSVPYFSGLRRYLARRGRYTANGQAPDFYQYAFTAAEFTKLTEQAGYEVLEITYQNPAKGITDESPWFEKLWNSSGMIRKALSPRLPLSRLLVPWFAHKLTIVARKTPDGL